MQEERALEEQPYLPFPLHTLRSKKRALEELSEPCGRFRSPLRVEESIRLLISKQSRTFDVFGDATHVVGPGAPLNWYALLRYLRRQGVTENATFTFRSVYNDLPKLYIADLHAPNDIHKKIGYSSGFGYAREGEIESALSKAIGELLERYTLMSSRYDSPIRASYHDMRKRRGRTLNIFELNDFLPWQKEQTLRFKRDAQTPMHWVRGKTFDGRTAYLPAQLVFWDYYTEHDKEETILAQATTNGAAGHFSREEAILAGLLEHIQRDGFLIYWLNHLSPKIIDVAEVGDPKVQEILTSMQRYGLEIYFLNTTSDITVPSITCTIVDRRTDEPMLAMGASTGFNLEELIVHSADEALAVFNAAKRYPAYTLPRDYRPFSDSTLGHTRRLSVWRGKTMLERFSFFISGKCQCVEDFMGGKKCGDSPQEQLQYVVDTLHTKGSGYEIYLYEARHKVLKALGYHVVRTIVPQLIPLHLSEHLATLDSKRLREVPGKLGLTPAKELNPWPHPFP